MIRIKAGLVWYKNYMYKNYAVYLGQLHHIKIILDIVLDIKYNNYT